MIKIQLLTVQYLIIGSFCILWDLWDISPTHFLLLSSHSIVARLTYQGTEKAKLIYYALVSDTITKSHYDKGLTMIDKSRSARAIICWLFLFVARRGRWQTSVFIAMGSCTINFHHVWDKDHQPLVYLQQIVFFNCIPMLSLYITN